MNTYKSLIYAALLIAVISSCQKADKKETVTGGSFPNASSALTISNAAPLLADSIKNDTVEIFKWSAAVYDGPVPITYNLQIDVPSDTSASVPWGKATTYPMGSAFRLGMVVQDINTLANNMGLAAGGPGVLVARVVANVNQSNGVASAVPSAYSNTVAITIIPYSVILYVPNSAQIPTPWTPATAPVLGLVPDSSGKYEGYVFMPGTASQSFKYTDAPDFNHVNYGAGPGNTLTTNGSAAGMSVPVGGYYEVTANFTTNPATWSATKTIWSIIGDATPGGWTTDTQMSYDSVGQVWTVTAAMLQAGSYKFRANDAWTIDFGIDTKGNLQYADNPFLAYNSTLNNLTVPADGTYTITLDLHISGKYTYTAIKH